jgi:hypothetical protein
MGAPVSRDDGFPIADVDSGYFEDAKVRALWQRLRDPDRMARALCLHSATVLASWRQGCRVSAAAAAPMWLLADPELMAALRSAKLLDRSGRLPIASWEQWFGPAASRRDQARAAGRVGNAKRWGTGSRPDRDPIARAIPDLPTDLPTDTPDARADLEAFLEVRFRVPTPAQRTFMDGYCRTFDATGPARAARLILSHPDDPIGALKEDLAAFRDQRRRDAEAQEPPKPRPRRAPALTGVNGELAKMLQEQDEKREQDRLERLAAAQPAGSVA